ncbi:hypothetical protein T484DRAFT_1756071 [Baffinella frigidus]|nr:hypothetical protein T484DRAFT_1756071 [Cryptophyta sp. CCMP2293]
MEIGGDYEMTYRMSRMNHHGHYCGVCFQFKARLLMMCCGFVMCRKCQPKKIRCPMQRDECAKRGINGEISMQKSLHGAYVIYDPCKLKYEITESMSRDIADRILQDIFTSLTQSNAQKLIGLCKNLVCVGHVLLDCVQSGVFTKEQFKGLVRLAKKLLPKVAWNDMYVLAYQYLSRLRGYFSHIPDHTTTEETRRRFQTEAREIHDLQQIQWEVATQRMSLQTRRTWNNNSRVYPITESVRNRSNEPAWRPIHQQAQWYQSGQST